MKQFTAEDVRKLREDTGEGVIMKNLIEELARDNNIVHKCLSMHKYDMCSYKECLEQMVVALATVNAQQQDTLVEIATRAAYNFVMEK